MASAAIRRMGNSHGVLLPKAVLTSLGLRAGDQVSLALEDGHLVLTPILAAPRAGWQEAARQIGAEEDGQAEWLAFANDADADLRW